VLVVVILLSLVIIFYLVIFFYLFHFFIACHSMVNKDYQYLRLPARLQSVFAACTGCANKNNRKDVRAMHLGIF